MGTLQVIRVVLDTNVLVSGLLFEGSPAKVLGLCKTGPVRLTMSRDILDEILRVLAYPRFRLSEEEIHYLLYVVLAFFSVTTHMFTRRKKGFRITPMDFIVVVQALTVAVLPRDIVPEEALKKVIPMIITLFFGYEVLTGELRGNISTLTVITIATLMIVAVRGIF